MNTPELTRETVDAIQGPVLLEFGATWCPHCLAVAPAVVAMLGAHPEVQHIKIEDGPGRALGRSFRVKLWPTLVFLRDGKVVRIAVRPGPEAIRDGFEAITRSI